MANATSNSPQVTDKQTIFLTSLPDDVLIEIASRSTKAAAENLAHTHNRQLFTLWCQQNLLTRLLNHVALGEQDEAEKILKTRPDLLLFKGNLQDHAGRDFTHITAFQYALWALDWHMWKMILKYLPRDEAAKQLQELETNSTAHGTHFDLNPLITALNNYIAYNSVQPSQYWCKEINDKQHLVPAHVAQEYCRTDRSFDLHGNPPTFDEDILPRNLGVYRSAPYTVPYYGFDTVYGQSVCDTSWFGSTEKLGVKCAYYRASLPNAWSRFGEGTAAWTKLAGFDSTALFALRQTRHSQFLALKQELLSSSPVKKIRH